MPIILPPPLLLPRPAIIRPAEPQKYGTFPFPVWSPKITAMPSGTYIGASRGNFNAGTPNTYTWASAPIGTAVGDVLLIGVMRESAFASTATGLTVGGSPATLWGPGEVVLGLISGAWLAFYIIQPGAVATANIVYTCSAGATGGNILAWRLPGMNPTPVGTATSAQASSTSMVLASLVAKATGTVIGMACAQPTITGFTESWGGAEAPVEDFDGNSATGGNRIGAARVPILGNSTNSLTFTLSASQAHTGIGISFGP